MRRTFGRRAIGIGVGQTLAPVSMKIVAVLLHDLAEKTPEGIDAPTAHFIAPTAHFIALCAHIIAILLSQA
jgi:hypothetical protein